MEIKPLVMVAFVAVMLFPPRQVAATCPAGNFCPGNRKMEKQDNLGEVVDKITQEQVLAPRT